MASHAGSYEKEEVMVAIFNTTINVQCLPKFPPWWQLWTPPEMKIVEVCEQWCLVTTVPTSGNEHQLFDEQI